MVSLVFGRFWEPVLHLVQLISTHCLLLYCWNMLECFLQMSHRSHPGPPFTVPAVSVILFFEKVFVRLGWRGMVCRAPFSFTANAAEAGSSTCFLPLRSLLTPEAFFITQDHVDALCYGTSRFFGFLSFGQHTIFLCVQNATFLTCPKCKDKWWTIPSSPMFQCVLIRKPACHAVRELQPYFQLPSIVWVSKRFGLLRFWKISFCATSWPSGLSKSWPIRVVASSWWTCFQLVYGQPRSETSKLWKIKNTEQNQIDNVTHNQAAPLNAKWLNWTLPYNTLTPHPSTSQDNRVDWAQLNTTVTQRK